MGDVMGDLNRRRGQIEGMEERGDSQVIRAHVPLAEMFGYVNELRSMTRVAPRTRWSFRTTLRCRATSADEIKAKSSGKVVRA